MFYMQKIQTKKTTNKEFTIMKKLFLLKLDETLIHIFKSKNHRCRTITLTNQLKVFFMKHFIFLVYLISKQQKEIKLE